MRPLKRTRRAEKRIMMNCEHKNKERRQKRGYGKVGTVLVEQCLDCGHAKRINICEDCGHGEAIYIHQIEPEHCCGERTEEWITVCEACHIAIQS